MRKTYIFRGGLEAEFYVESVKGRAVRIIYPKLPIEFGPFRLDWSPNSEFYLDELGGGFNEGVFSMDVQRPYKDYPNSTIYVETKIEVEDGEDVEIVADEIFEELEAMLRLFQVGNVYIGRNMVVGTYFEKGKLTWYGYVFKPKPEPLYQRQRYLINDAILEGFKKYFSRYWETVHSKPKRIYSAIRRFSSSYEKRVSSDRLIELVIGLESIFGDGADSIAYKIALRVSCFIYPPGEDRKRAFTSIKRAYEDRSKIIHGVRSEAKYKEEIDDIEDLLRKAINKLLEWEVNGTRISSVEELDNILFFSNVS
jgi:hypothetical protein